MNTDRPWDVAVVGAGPAGATAAHDLARSGLRVVLIEKAALPRYKTCGGGVVWRARQRLPVPIDAAVERECHTLTLSFLESDLHFTVCRTEPVVTMTMRAALDQLLAEAAVGAGAQLLDRCAVESVQLDGRRVALGTPRGTIEADYVVAADGALGATAQLAGWPAAGRGIPALEWELTVAPDLFRRFERAARFDFEVVDDGYGWVFPKRDHLSVGVLSTRPGTPGLAGMLERYLKRIGLDDRSQVERHGFVIPVGSERDQLAHDRVLLVGDAAGLVDPITCEGISHAVHSARLAAECLVEGALEPADVGRRYTARVRQEILRDLRLARRLAGIVYRPTRLRRSLFRIGGQGFCEAMAEVCLGHRSYRAMLTRLSNYFKLLAGHGRPRATTAELS